MKTIVMDSANKYLVVALYENQKCLASLQEEGNRKQSEYAIVYLQKLLQENHLKMSDFDEMVITIGPGSYTGVRVALTIAKTLNATMNIKVKTVSSLKAMAGMKKAISILDARSHKLFLGIYNEGKVIVDDCLINIDEFENYQKQYTDYEIVGDTHLVGIPEKEAEERKKIQISSWLIAYEGEPTRTGGVEMDIRTEEREKLKENNIKRDGISNVDWYSYEEYTTEDGKLTINKYAVEQYKNIGGKVSEQPDVNGAFVNEKGRYWVAVGPEILSPGYNEQPVEEQTISDNQFKYGTEIDVVLQNSKDKSEVYIECIIGDVKAHTYPNGVFQTGDAYPNCSSKDDGSKHRNGSYIEFINESKFEDNYINGNMSDYVVIDIIVYERNVGCCEKKDCEYGDDRNSSYNSAGWCLKL